MPRFGGSAARLGGVFFQKEGRWFQPIRSDKGCSAYIFATPHTTIQHVRSPQVHPLSCTWRSLYVSYVFSLSEPFCTLLHIRLPQKLNLRCYGPACNYWFLPKAVGNRQLALRVLYCDVSSLLIELSSPTPRTLLMEYYTSTSTIIRVIDTCFAA